MAVPWPLQPASYNGIQFFVQAQSRASGRRIVPKEVPKSDAVYTEDMGRRVRKFNVTAYIIYSPVLDADWEKSRTDLYQALETDGTGTLMLPTMLSNDVVPVIVGPYTVTEHQEKGGYAEFQIEFTEAGQDPSAQQTADTQAASQDAAAQTATDATSSTDMTSYYESPQPAMGASMTDTSGMDVGLASGASMTDEAGFNQSLTGQSSATPMSAAQTSLGYGGVGSDPSTTITPAASDATPPSIGVTATPTPAELSVTGGT